jgi:O-antigen ligase
MKSNEAVSRSRSPELEPIRNDLVKLKVMWSMCCVTPILYLVIAQVITTNVFAWRETPGFFHVGNEAYRYLLMGVLGLALLAQGLIVYVRRFYERRMRSGSRHAAKLLQCYLKRTLFLVILSETTVLSGFILFILNGQLAAVFATGLVGLLYYAQSYPSERGLHAVSRSV